jgi:hypothetical protein
MYVDEGGQKWHVCAFWKPSVLSRRAEVPGSEAELATVVFERPGEERVALTTSVQDWDTNDNLRKLFLCAAERREGRERRSGRDRRLEHVGVATDHRSGGERRSGEPRRSRDQALAIRAVAMLGSHPVCPRCQDDLLVGPSVMRGEGTIRQLSCPTCARTVMVRGMM